MATNLSTLILEDNEFDAELEVAALERGGYTCRWTRVQTRDELSSHLRDAAYDVIIADHNLPSFDAFAALKLVRDAALDIPFILVSGNGGEELAVESLKAGMTDYVAKSRLDRLPAVVRRALRERQTERERRDAEETSQRLAAIVESSDDAIIGQTLDGIITSWNRGAAHLYGYAAPEVVGKPFTLLVPADRVQEVAAILERLQRGDSVHRYETLRRRKDGTLVEVAVTPSPVHGRSGTPIGVSTIARDITERRRADEALRNSEAHTRAIVEAAVDGIMTIDEQGRIESFNSAAERLFQYTPREVIGQNVSMLMPEPYRGEHNGYLARYLQTGDAKIIGIGRDVVAQRKDGSTFPVHLSVGEARMSDRTLFVGIIQDISERVHIEEALRALNLDLERRVGERTAELEGTNKELEAFSYSVSHDLRAPLRHMGGFVSLLRERAGEQVDETAHRYLDVIAGAVDKMGRLIDDLLVFSRMSRTELRHERVALDDLVQEARAELAPALTGRTIAWKIGSLPVVEGDRSLLYLVVLNLLSNAIKYTARRADAHIAVGTAPGAGEVQLFVRDNGAGFDMAYADKLFGVFQRLHRDDEFEGTGIGLATVRRIVHRHGGHVWAEAEVDHGATFWWTLPAPQEEQRGPEEDSAC